MPLDVDLPGADHPVKGGSDVAAGQQRRVGRCSAPPRHHKVPFGMGRRVASVRAVEVHFYGQHNVAYGVYAFPRHSMEARGTARPHGCGRVHLGQGCLRD